MTLRSKQHKIKNIKSEFIEFKIDKKIDGNE